MSEQRTPNLHAFMCTYHGWTNTKPSRIKIVSLRFDEYVWMSLGDNLHWEIDVVDHLTKLGFNIVGQAEYKRKSFIILSDTFKSIKDEIL